MLIPDFVFYFFILFFLRSDQDVTCFRRNHNVRDILKGISLGSKNLNFCDASNHFHHLFFFGDLNYRLDELDSVVSLSDHFIYCLFLVNP